MSNDVLVIAGAGGIGQAIARRHGRRPADRRGDHRGHACGGQPRLWGAASRADREPMAGGRIGEAPGLAENVLDADRGAVRARSGKGGRRREAGMPVA